MPRILTDMWVPAGQRREFTAMPEGMEFVILNKGQFDHKVRLAFIFNKGRKKKGQPMANPKIEDLEAGK